MSVKNSIISKLSEDSKDSKLIHSISLFLNHLEMTSIDYICIGSLAIFSYFDNVFRLPNDLDVVIESHSLNKLKNSFGYEFKQRLGFYEALIDKFKIHIVIDGLKIIDFSKESIIGTVNINFKEKTRKSINFLADSKQITINVPRIETLFLLNLLTPLNSNIILDTIRILGKYDLENERIKNILIQNELFKDIFEYRLFQLQELFSKREVILHSKLKQLIKCLEKDK